jgi:hypothetical protein
MADSADRRLDDVSRVCPAIEGSAPPRPPLPPPPPLSMQRRRASEDILD